MPRRQSPLPPPPPAPFGVLDPPPPLTWYFISYPPSQKPVIFTHSWLKLSKEDTFLAKKRFPPDGGVDLWAVKITMFLCGWDHDK